MIIQRVLVYATSNGIDRDNQLGINSLYNLENFNTTLLIHADFGQIN